MPEETESSTRLTSLKDYALQHPAAVLTVAGIIGYFAAHGYFAGKAQILGIPFGFTLSTSGYVEVFLQTAIFMVASLAAVLVSGSVIKASESKPRLGNAFGITYLAMVVAALIAVLTFVSLRRWLIDLYEPLLPLFVYSLFTLIATWVLVRVRRRLYPSLIFTGIALIALYFVMSSIGTRVEQSRTSWQVASTNGEYFVVAGHRGDLLLVAPLISTSPPTYVKQFRYLDAKAPDLRLQKVELKEMVREEASLISLP